MRFSATRLGTVAPRFDLSASTLSRFCNYAFCYCGTRVVMVSCMIFLNSVGASLCLHTEMPKKNAGEVEVSTYYTFYIVLFISSYPNLAYFIWSLLFSVFLPLLLIFLFLINFFLYLATMWQPTYLGSHRPRAALANTTVAPLYCTLF